MELLPELRMGRNFIRPGDTIKVKPSQPGRRDGFEAKVKRIARNKNDEIEIDVIGDGRWRTVRPERVQRMSQSKQRRKDEA